MTNNSKVVFDIIRNCGDEGINVAEICAKPASKALGNNPEQIRANVNFAIGNLMSDGFIKIFRTARPRRYHADLDFFEKSVIEEINAVAAKYFRGELGALQQFIEATVKKGQLR